jgi:hypothetical protein
MLKLAEIAVVIRLHFALRSVMDDIQHLYIRGTCSICQIHANWHGMTINDSQSLHKRLGLQDLHISHLPIRAHGTLLCHEVSRKTPAEVYRCSIQLALMASTHSLKTADMRLTGESRYSNSAVYKPEYGFYKSERSIYKP